MDLPCRSLSDYFRERFGEKVYKLPLDARMSCPNRDGSKGTGGCSFCNPLSFRPDYLSGTECIEWQLRKGRGLYRERDVDLFLAYFQTGTNTYASADRLAELFRRALRPPDVVGLSVGTRPDCLPSEVVDLLGRIAEDHEVWVEIGQQSSNDETLQRTNRCHSWKDYREAVDRLRQYPSLKLCTHVMFGLPGETPDDMHRTIRDLRRVGLDGIKFHQTQVIRGTRLERQYRTGDYRPVEYETYRDLVVRALGMLPARTVIHRLISETTPRWLVAPRWDTSKGEFIREVEERTRTGPSPPASSEC